MAEETRQAGETNAVEVTPEMEAAGVAAWYDYSLDVGSVEEKVAYIFKAMIAARCQRNIIAAKDESCLRP